MVDERLHLGRKSAIFPQCHLQAQLPTMSPWVILPLSLPVLIISGIWIVVYNQSCDVPLSMQRGPELCCTLDYVPLISKCGALPPESCFFSLICSTGSFMVMLIGVVRYAQIIQRHSNSFLNMASLSIGWLCATGLLLVGNFQVDSAKVLHYVGAGMAFPTSLLFVCLESTLTLRLAKTPSEQRVGHLRLAMALLAFSTLLLAGVFFVQDSPELQHASAILEWLFTMTIMLYYGTFAFEFRRVSRDTLLALLSRGRRDLCANPRKGEKEWPSSAPRQEYRNTIPNDYYSTITNPAAC